MTYEEWLEELDTLVAERVMGWKYDEGAGAWYRHADDAIYWCGDDFEPTQNWFDAGRVLEKLWHDVGDVSLWHNLDALWGVSCDGGDFSSIAETPQLVIVLVALEWAVGVEIPEEPKRE